MLAVFWDNLYQSGGAKVFQKYDAANHWWVVEWSRLRNEFNGATEVFEAILLDPVHHPTPTGDGEIIFQYHTVSNPDWIDGYATVGIESPGQSDGVLYTFFNRYPDGAAPLQAGRAIRFLPVSTGPRGRLGGIVSNASAGGSPIGAATVKIIGKQDIENSQAIFQRDLHLANV